MEVNAPDASPPVAPIGSAVIDYGRGFGVGVTFERPQEGGIFGQRERRNSSEGGIASENRPRIMTLFTGVGVSVVVGTVV